jgi:hypothetical protein
MVGVVCGRAVRHLDKKTAWTLDQQRQCIMRRDQMGMDTETEHAQAVLEVMRPDGLVPFLQILAAPQVIHQDVETTLLGAGALDQLSDLVSDEMIDPNGYAVAAGCRNELGRFLDGFGPGIFGLLLACRPSGHVDRRAGSPSSTAMPRPAPRVAPATRATFSFKRHRPPEYSRLNREQGC